MLKERQEVLSFNPKPLTSEVKLLYWFSKGGLFVLVVGDGGVLEHKPVLFVRTQRESFRPEMKLKRKIKKINLQSDQKIFLDSRGHLFIAAVLLQMIREPLRLV